MIVFGFPVQRFKGVPAAPKNQMLKLVFFQVAILNKNKEQKMCCLGFVQSLYFWGKE